MKGTSCILNSIIFAVLLNIILPLIIKPFASEEEIKPPNGAENLTLKGQFVHMMIHHNQVPLIISFIIALIVGLSIYLGYVIDPMKYLKKLKISK